MFSTFVRTDKLYVYTNKVNIVETDFTIKKRGRRLNLVHTTRSLD